MVVIDDDDVETRVNTTVVGGKEYLNYEVSFITTARTRRVPVPGAVLVVRVNGFLFVLLKEISRDSMSVRYYCLFFG